MNAPVFGAGADPLAAARAVDAADAAGMQPSVQRPAAPSPLSYAHTDPARYDRRAMSANAILFALQQRGERQFTAACIQAMDNITANLDLIALGIDARERVPEGSEGPPQTYSDALAKVNEALAEIPVATAEAA